METKYIMMTVVAVLIVMLGAVQFIKKSAWYRKMKAVGADVGDTVNSTFGWITSPWLWMFVFWGLYNPWGYSYYDFVKGYDFGDNIVLNIVVVALGAFLAILSLYFLTKAWKKLAWLGHVAYIAFMIVYGYSLYETSHGDLSQINVPLHILVLLTIYAGWGMLYPKLSKRTHAEVGVNLDTDDVDAISYDE